MGLIALILFGIAFFVCLPFRLVVMNLFKVLRYAPTDFFAFIKNKAWNIAPVGFIDAYTGLFGRGKTLSAVHFAVNYYKKYNNTLVYDFHRHGFVRQYVQLLSNVQLKVPYIEFSSMSQIVDIAEHVQQFNEENDCRLITLVLGDEFSTQMNSRNFKSNLDALTLNAILTCRHHGISLIYTAQRFGHVDALLRQVTSSVIECNKIWRLQCHNTYDAWDLENAGSSLKVKPLSRGGFFVTDADYNAYDSIAVVENLVKDWKNGDMMSAAEILLAQGVQNSSEDNARRLKKKYRKKSA